VFLVSKQTLPRVFDFCQSFESIDFIRVPAFLRVREISLNYQDKVGPLAETLENSLLAWVWRVGDL
jgi:hypothetical protein